MAKILGETKMIDTLNIIFGILMFISAVALVVMILMQRSKAHGLSGSISGAADTFFGKAKGQTIDKKLNKITTIVAIVFVVLDLLVFLMN